MGEATLGKCFFLFALIVGIIYWGNWYSAKHNVEYQIEQKIDSGEYYKEELQRQRKQFKENNNKELTESMKRLYKKDASSRR